MFKFAECFVFFLISGARSWLTFCYGKVNLWNDALFTGLLATHHRVAFTGSGLSVGEDTDIIPDEKSKKWRCIDSVRGVCPAEESRKEGFLQRGRAYLTYPSNA